MARWPGSYILLQGYKLTYITLDRVNNEKIYQIGNVEKYFITSYAIGTRVLNWQIDAFVSHIRVFSKVLVEFDEFIEFI